MSRLLLQSILANPNIDDSFKRGFAEGLHLLEDAEVNDAIAEFRAVFDQIPRNASVLYPLANQSDIEKTAEQVGAVCDASKSASIAHINPLISVLKVHHARKVRAARDSLIDAIDTAFGDFVAVLGQIKVP